MEKPKYYLHNEGRLNDRFVFISYSHRNEEQVYDILRQLYDLGINYWYDDGLNVGDFWNEKVEEVLRNPDCVGSIVFLSEESVVSDPVNQEVGIMLELKKERGFVIAPVVIGYDLVDDLIYEMCTKDRAFSKKTRTDKFYINEIALDDTNCRIGESVPRLVTFAEGIDAKETHSVVIGNTDIDKLPHLKANGRKYYRLGKYPYDAKGTKHELCWELLSRDEDTIYMISQYCIDFAEKSEIPHLLTAIKNSIVEYADCIEDVIIPDEEFMRENANKISQTYVTDYADSRRDQLLRCIWIKSKVDGEFVLYNTLGIKVNECINHEIITAGIRPVIIINNKKINKEKHK